MQYTDAPRPACDAPLLLHICAHEHSSDGTHPTRRTIHASLMHSNVLADIDVYTLLVSAM